MRSILFIFLLAFGSTTSAQVELADSPAKVPSEGNAQADADSRVMSTRKIVETLYRDPDCRYIGFGVSNHRMQYPLQEMEVFLKSTAKDDLSFRHILIEGPVDAQSAFIAASKGEISVEQLHEHVDPFWHNHLAKHPQLSYCVKLLSVLREINAARPDRPILMMMIDAADTQQMTSDRKRILNQRVFKRPNLYVESINRERDTAQNVLTIFDKAPQAKGVILYHQAHILKNLKRVNKTLDAEYQVLSEKLTHSNWVGFACEARPEFLKGLRIICFDEADDLFNPDGSLDVNALAGRQYPPGTGSVITDTAMGQLDPSTIFRNSCFLQKRHHTQFPPILQDVFDAFVIVPPTPE